MALNADTLLDRLHLKQQVQKWRIIAIIAMVVAAIVAIERQTPDSPMGRDFVARLTVDGIITDDKDRFELIKDLKENHRVKAVIVELDTPGGSAVGGEELYLKLRDLAKVKPVVAVMRSLCASAGYMTALGTDYIIARDGTITGSIGVLIQTAEISDLAAKLGVNPITIKSAPLKGSPSLLEKPTPEGKQVLQTMIDDFYQVFVTMVAERRQLPRDEALRLADGRVYSGKRALELKLIDAIGGEEEAMQWLQAQKKISPTLTIKDVEVKRKGDSVFDQVSESIITKFFPQASAGLDGLVAIWHPAVQIQ